MDHGAGFVRERLVSVSSGWDGRLPRGCGVPRTDVGVGGRSIGRTLLTLDNNRLPSDIP